MNLAYKLKHFLFDPKGRNKELLQNSTVFCMSPWIQLHAQTNGKIAPCCMSSIHDGNEIGDLNVNPDLADSWNSDNMKQLRLDMLSGKKNSICSNCHDYEAMGRSSERHYYNRDYMRYFSRVKDTGIDGSLAVSSIPILDIRFSNKCNYKCRICNSDYSSLWYEEEKKLGKAVNPLSKEIKVAADEMKFWESFKSLLPTVKRMHFAGGEPLFMDEHYATLEYLIQIGNTDITLTYNTNFSTLRYKKHNVIDLWKKFKKVVVWASLDGMGARGDYQRKGQKWQDIEDNFRTVQLACRNVMFGVNVTVSIFNVMDVPAFYRYMVEQKFVKPELMNLYPLFYPHHFSVDNLPADMKLKVVETYEAFERDYLSTLKKSDNIKNHCRAIVTLVKSGDRDLKAKLKDAINSVDAIRGENFAEVFPDIAGLAGDSL